MRQGEVPRTGRKGLRLSEAATIQSATVSFHEECEASCTVLVMKIGVMVLCIYMLYHS